MNHVFVETNFIIDVLRPFPTPDATALRQRVGGDVTLHIPWVAVAEAARTLPGVIREDLGFMDNMKRFAAVEFQNGTLSRIDKPIVDELAKRARDFRDAELKSVIVRVEALAAQTSVIEPTKPVVTRTLTLFSVKSLKPFDEMVLGAVLTKAEELYQAGERELFFCDKNTRDFEPTNRPALDGAYRRCGLAYKSGFVVP